jgi:1-acyl-sn-glycerol-3-phosphate acyltransferase
MNGNRHSLLELVSHVIRHLIWRFGSVFYKRWFSLQVSGLELLPEQGPYLLVANHCSHLDGPAVAAARGRHYHQLFSLGARDYFFRNRLGAWVSRNILNMIPMDRVRFDFRALAECRRVTAAGGVVLMFPEGTRSETGQLQRFKPGFGLLATRLNLPVIPVLISGTHEALPKGRPFPRRSRIRVTFGPPLDLGDYDPGGTDRRSHVYRQIADGLYNAICRLATETQGTDALSRYGS